MRDYRDYAELVDNLRKMQSTEYCAIASATDFPAIRIVNDAADAIEELLAAVHSVVHCKDCRWCHAGYCEKYDDLIPFGCAKKPWEDWFCADGKRREAKKEAQDAD